MPRTLSVRVFFIALVLLLSPAALAQTEGGAAPAADDTAKPDATPKPEEKAEMLPEKDDDDVESEADMRARDLYAVGRDLYEGGRYQAALEVFEEAYALSPRPLLLLSLASTYERLGDYDKALEALRRYQPYVEEDKRSKLEKRMESLENRLAEMQKQRDEDKEKLDKLPPPEKESGPLTTWGWISIGTGAALAVGGGVAILLGEADYTDAEDKYSSGAISYDDAVTLIEDGDLKHYIGYGVAGLGGAAIITGVVLIIMDQDDAPSDVQAGFAPTEDGAVFTLMGRF